MTIKEAMERNIRIGNEALARLGSQRDQKFTEMLAETDEDARALAAAELCGIAAGCIYLLAEISKMRGIVRELEAAGLSDTEQETKQEKVESDTTIPSFNDFFKGFQA